MKEKRFAALIGTAMKVTVMQIFLVTLFAGTTFAKNASLASGASTTDLTKIVIRGKVTDSKGEALIGVSVKLKGNAAVGVATDVNGQYTLDVPAGSTLQFNYVGFVTKEVAIGANTTINVTLEDDAQSLEEVVVVAYGTVSKGTSTGAISAVKAEDLVRTPSTTTAGALVGKVAGITTRAGDSRPGAATNLQIRNLGTPLYVIDGVPADDNQFNQLNMNDIESISLLKDGSAAIYGLRAANGVVLVTTKKGRSGEAPRINLTTYYGVSNYTRFPEQAQSFSYVSALNQSAINLAEQGLSTPSLQLPYSQTDLDKWQAGTEKGYINTDYFEVINRANVPQYQMTASAQGGSEKSNYYVSAGYVNQEAVIKGNKFDRYNFKGNIEAALGKGFTVGTRLTGRLEDRYAVGIPGVDEYPNAFLSVFSMWPTERMFANDNPLYVANTHNINVNPATYQIDITGWNDEQKQAFNGQWYAKYEFPFGLVAQGTISYDQEVQRFENQEYVYSGYNYNATTDTYTAAGGNQNPWRRKQRYMTRNRFKQFQLSYSHKFGSDHSVSAVAAFEQQDRYNDEIQYNTLPANNFIHITRLNEMSSLNDSERQQAREGLIARGTYSYKRKYNIDFGGRYDGSYLYAPGNRYGFFPTGGVSWVLSEEPFIKNAIGSFVNDLKLRYSYGKTGREEGINTNDFLNNNGSPVYNYGVGNAVLNGTYILGIQPRSALPPLNLTWATSTTQNIGIDFGLFNKFNATFEVFERKLSGLPAARYDVLLPLEVGYTLPNENLESTKTVGAEAQLSYNAKLGPVNYTVGLNATLARNKIVNKYKPRPGNSLDKYFDTGYEGRWANVLLGYQVTGQFQSVQEIGDYTIDNDGSGNRTMLPGDLIYKDINGDGVINAQDIRSIGFNSQTRASDGNPFLNFGWTNSFQYKGFSLLFDFAGATMQTLVRNVELKIPFQNNGTSPVFIFDDAWHHADPIDPTSPWVSGKYPPVRKDQAGHNNYSRNSSDFWTTNINYIRLRNLELGYSFSQNILRKIGVTNLRVYANMSNVFSIDNTNEYGIDPENTSQSGLQYPTTKVTNFGLNLTL